MKFICADFMAASCFYYLQVSDRVRCAFCNVEVGHWEKGDDPMHITDDSVNLTDLKKQKECHRTLTLLCESFSLVLSYAKYKFERKKEQW